MLHERASSLSESRSPTADAVLCVQCSTTLVYTYKRSLSSTKTFIEGTLQRTGKGEGYLYIMTSVASIVLLPV